MFAFTLTLAARRRWFSPTAKRIRILRLALVALIVCATVSALVAITRPKKAAVVHAAARSEVLRLSETGVKLSYRGGAANPLASGQAQARALAIADFNLDAAPDLVSAYATSGAGIITLQKGNTDAYAPKDDSVFQRIQKGYKPEPFETTVQEYTVPEAPDFLLTGDFNRDGVPDLVMAARGGGLYLMPGDGSGLGGADRISLPGRVTALAGGQQSGRGSEIVVGVEGDDGFAVLVFYSSTGMRTPAGHYQLSAPATSIGLGLLDDDRYSDFVVVSAGQLQIFHGAPGDSLGRTELVSLSFAAKSVTLGDFIWDRDGRTEMAVLAEDGTVKILQRGQLDTRPLTEDEEDARMAKAYAEAESRRRAESGNQNANVFANVEVDSAIWQPDRSLPWSVAKEVADANLDSYGSPVLQRSRVSSQLSDDLVTFDSQRSQIQVMKMGGTRLRNKTNSASVQVIPDNTVTIESESSPAAVIDLPPTITGRQGLIALQSGKTQPFVSPPLTPSVAFIVNTLGDGSDSNTADGICNDGTSHCSLRAAMDEADANTGTAYTITFSVTGTISLVNGSLAGSAIGNTNETITGPGASSLTIDQTAAANTRHLRATSGGLFSVSGVTFFGGSGFTFGGGSVLCGGTTSVNNQCTFTNVTFKNNSTAKTDLSTGTSGGAIANGAGGNVTVTGCTFGGPNASDANTAFNNFGGAIAFDNPSGSTGNLTISTTLFQGNIANEAAGINATKPAGGAIYMNSLSGSQSIQNCTFLSNQAQGTGANAGTGGAIQIGNGNGTTNVNLNRFLGNTQAAAGGGGAVYRNANLGGAVVTNDWWGCDGFPGTAGCDSAFPTTSTTNPGDNQIQFDPRIDLTFTASPGTICRTGSPTSTTVTADVTKNTNGTSVNGGNAPSVLVGLDVSFASGSLGSLSGSSPVAIPSGGTIAKTFSVGANHGTATPTAQLDNTPAASASILIPDSFSSVATGSFDTDTTWSPQCVPQSDDSVTINNTHNVSLAVSRSIADVTINSGGTLTTGAFNLNVNSSNDQKNYSSVNSWSNSGTLSGLGTVTFNGNNQLQKIAGTTTFNNLTINHTGSSNVTASGSTLTVNALLRVQSGLFISSSTFNDVQIDNGATLQSDGGTINVHGNWTNDGTFTANGGTVIFNGSGSQTINGAATTAFNILTIGNTSQPVVVSPTTNSMTAAGNLTVNANAILSPAATAIIGGTGTLTGSGTAQVTRTAATPDFLSQYTITNKTLTNLTVDYNATAAQTVNAINYGSLTISGNRGGASVTLGSGTVGVSGAFSSPATNVSYITTGNTFNFNGAGAQIVPGFNYNNLTISGARTSNTNVTLANGGTIGVAGTFSATAAFSGTGKFDITNNTIDFNGSGAQTVPAFSFNNLTISQARGTNNVTFASGPIKIAGTLISTATFTNPGHIDLTTNNNTIEYNGTSAQTMDSSFPTYNNLTLSNSSGVTGFSGLTVNGLLEVKAGTFTSATTYNNVQIDSGATLAATADITVNGNWTDNGTFTANTSTVNFNGSAAQTIGLTSSSTTPFYNLSISNTSATVSLGHNVTVSNILAVNANATFDLVDKTANGAPGSQTSISNGATLKIGGTNGFPSNYTNHTFGSTSTVEYESSSAQTITALAEAYGNLKSSSSGGRTLPSGQTVKVFNTFTPGTNTYTITGSTMDFDGNGAQSLPAFSYNNLTISNDRSGATFTLPSGTVKIAGTFTASATNVTYDVSTNSNTVEYNGASAQSMPSSFTTYNNLTVSNSSVAGVTGFSGLVVQGTLTVNAGSKFTSSTSFGNVLINGTLAGSSGTAMDVSGNWTNNGTFTANGNTVNFIGTGAQTIGGTNDSQFNNLTINNTNGTQPGVTLGRNETVNGTLTLTTDLGTSTFTLTQPNTGTSAGPGDVVGSVKRTGFDTGGANTLSFGNPLNTIQINSDTVSADTISITVKLAKSVPNDANTGGTNSGFPGAVQRTYVITPTGITGTIAATLQLRYLTSELNGNTEATLRLWRFNGTGWSQQDTLGTSTTVDLINHDVSLTGVSTFSPWTLANVSPTAANSNISGRITDTSGNPVEGAAVRITGTENRLAVTDAQGNYHFENVEANGFYAVTPSRANYTFSPSQRSFSQLGLHTEAAFSAAASSTTLNPLDTSEYFVRQQYVDFLGREPDETGLNFWVNNIESCSSDQNCRAAKRIDTSAAFFLSIEFQQTGYLVYRAYQAAYGDLAGTSVPVKLSEFQPDTQAIGNGVVVNQSGWEALLESNKQSYLTGFVGRARFTAAYPTSLSPSAFVDQLFANAGVTPSATDRTAAINEFGSATTTSDQLARGRALRRVTENAALMQKDFDSAFVLMQYFGYLRRDPNAMPDSNFEGYNFWLSKLDSFNGSYQNAEMVKAFISSTEYRGRFPR